MFNVHQLDLLYCSTTKIYECTLTLQDVHLYFTFVCIAILIGKEALAMLTTFRIATFIGWSICPCILTDPMFSICNPISCVLSPTHVSESSFSVLSVFPPLASVLVSVCICVSSMSVHTTCPPLTIKAWPIWPYLFSFSISLFTNPFSFICCSILKSHLFSKLSLWLFFNWSLSTWFWLSHRRPFLFCLRIVIKFFVFFLRKVFLALTNTPLRQVAFTLFYHIL